jgi:hypothetical protein
MFKLSRVIRADNTLTKGKRSKNDLHNVTQKTKDRTMRTPLQTGRSEPHYKLGGTQMFQKGICKSSIAKQSSIWDNYKPGGTQMFQKGI